MQFTGFELPELTHAATVDTSPLMKRLYDRFIKKDTLLVYPVRNHGKDFKIKLHREGREEEVVETCGLSIKTYQLHGRTTIELERHEHRGVKGSFYSVRYLFGKQYICIKEVPFEDCDQFPTLASLANPFDSHLYAVRWGDHTVSRLIQAYAVVTDRDSVHWDEAPPTSVQEMLRKHQKFLPQLLEHLGKIEVILRRQPAVSKYT